MDNWQEKLSELVVVNGPKIIFALIFLVIGFWLAGKLANMAANLMRKRNVEESIIPFLTSLISVGLKVLVLLAVAGKLGFETTGFAAVIGAATLAIGMALQGSLGHFASGVLIMTFRPYKVGDLIKVKGETGSVEEIQIFNTVLKTLDNKRIIIPNGVITSDVITNISGQGTIRVDMDYTIAYEEDIDQARTIINQVIASCPHVLQEEDNPVVIKEWGDSSVVFAVCPWAKSEHYWDVFFFMREQLKKAFDKANIEIPYNKMDVNIKKEA